MPELYIYIKSCGMFYSRQIPILGEEGQLKIRNTSVAIFGAGGLGTLIARYLVGGGFKTVTILDFDTVAPQTSTDRSYIHTTTWGSQRLKLRLEF